MQTSIAVHKFVDQIVNQGQLARCGGTIDHLLKRKQLLRTSRRLHSSQFLPCSLFSSETRAETIHGRRLTA